VPGRYPLVPGGTRELPGTDSPSPVRSIVRLLLILLLVSLLVVLLALYLM